MQCKIDYKDARDNQTSYLKYFPKITTITDKTRMF